jgi:hypothetical protein
MTTQRATQAEKAAAWDRMMESTATDANHAVMEAWQALRETVQARETAQHDAQHDDPNALREQVLANARALRQSSEPELEPYLGS